MKIPNSFGAWEQSKTEEFVDHIENYQVPLEDRLAELQDKLERGVLTYEEDEQMYELEEAIRDASLCTREMVSIFKKVDRAEGRR